MVVDFPNDFSPGTVSRFISTLFVYRAEPDIELNFSSIGFINPFSSLVLAHALKAFLNIRSKNGLTTRYIGLSSSTWVLGYLKHLGFFKFCGIVSGKDVDEANGSSTYLPFTRIRRNQIMWKGQVMQEEIDSKAERLAQVIFPGSNNAGPAMMLAYSIREVIRNSFEHGQVDQCIATAQRWANGDAEIAIADEGVGIFNSLRKTINYLTPDEAISASLLPGISSRSVTGNSKWANSGFGLYVISELGKRFGSFEIISSQRSLYYNAMGPLIIPVEIYGTFVRLRVSTRDADYFPNILHNIVEEGEKISELLPGAIKSASKMSKSPLTF